MVYTEKPENFISLFHIVSCFIEFENKILLLHRLPEKSQGNKWGNPAGKVEEGENLEQAMKREVFEETGLVVNENDLIFQDTTYVDYGEIKFIYSVFKLILNYLPEIIINPLEHQDYKWVTPVDALRIGLLQDQDYYVKREYRI